jgi:glucokinase
MRRVLRVSKSSDIKTLGIDLGGTKILTAVVTAGGEVVSRDRGATPAEAGHEAVVKSMLDSAGRALAGARLTAADLLAVGLGAPGLSNPETGILLTSPHLPGWKDVPLRDIMERRLGRRVFLINDASAAALGELYFGVGRGARDLIYVTVGTGIGGGIIVDGRLYTGSAGMAGEVGHMVVDDEGPPCDCGNRGCWETLVSGTALAREARRRIGEGAVTSLLEYAGGDIDGVSAETVHAAARAGDNLAKELMARAAYYLGVGLANLINIFNPEVVVIGGGLSEIGDMLLKPAFEEAGRRAYKQVYQAVRFARAELGRDSGVLGAAAFALGKMREMNGVTD